MLQGNTINTVRYNLAPTYPENVGIVWPTAQVLPTPFKEITRDQFDRLLHCGSHGIQGINFDTVILDWDGRLETFPENHALWSCHYYWLIDCGVCAAHLYGSKDRPPAGWKVFLPDGTNSIGAQYGFFMRYFRIGCEHEFVRTNVGKCLNTHKCSRCGFSVTWDSSD